MTKINLTPNLQIKIISVQRIIEHQKAFKVCQKKDGEIITTYSSLSDASKVTGISKGNISSCLSGRLVSINGFTWEIIDKDFSKIVQRSCLMCGNLFESNGPGNRRCKKCDKNVSHNTYQDSNYYKTHGIDNDDIEEFKDELIW